jgi:hypothetical protein
MLIKFAQLKIRDCHWPVAEADGEVLFCGEPAENGCLRRTHRNSAPPGGPEADFRATPRGRACYSIGGTSASQKLNRAASKSRVTWAGAKPTMCTICRSVPLSLVL